MKCHDIIAVAQTHVNDRPAREVHNRLMLTKAIDLSARLKRPLALPISPEDAKRRC